MIRAASDVEVPHGCPSTSAADFDTACRCCRRRCPNAKHAPDEAARAIPGSAGAWRDHWVHFSGDGAVAAIPIVAGSFIDGGGRYGFAVCDPDIYAQLDARRRADERNARQYEIGNQA